MPLELDENRATYQIRAFKPGLIQINGKVFTESVIIAPNRLIEHWAPQTITELTHDHLALAIALQPDILIIGTGTTLQFPAIELYGDFINQGIGIEMMDTSAACRTYNALTAENRNVVAALIIR